ncbi:hypothetical protein LEP1GSC103_0930 [Leptospira borgpetersenii serovar Javanica str. UI 09931]|uniref:Uncharacterized protein n=5 Tax=Leptospira borgpetersenii TaxID=174 RepID=M3FIH8_LEPBO|nr:hypothetical protein LBBP_00487 [Leptospira borgpetersenii serovar Ballum]AXX15340.1 hypothetical protein C4Q31_07110 [Leptospira borgpetersenii serovar Ceylonica]EKP12266.1 hypothetical protein LEP1GSC128_4123 [Leptospira borgpetersenii str. 200801926]EKQ91228.1 hypothetical protein LEP1GSC101_1392 [Leptospira borgpetersenii str. UI 09149]EKR02325.1 hypothetical protein LEP1GSC121_0780 [Leptospira borgpetersenii serovar Castellonis str. 200801910]EMG01618.1 hypothetical protein LEP1GSC123_
MYEIFKNAFLTLIKNRFARLNFIERKKFFLVDSSLCFLFLLFFPGEHQAKLDDLENPTCLKFKNRKTKR